MATVTAVCPTIDRPILFSGDMVREILQDRKTQTRRVAKFIPLAHGLNLQASSLSAGDYFTGRPELGKVLYSMGGSCWQQRTKPLRCPYGKPGDRLWVRESFTPARWGTYDPLERIPKGPEEALIQYRADYVNGSSVDYDAHWKPAIHMPRWASRIALEVTKVRLERVKQISHEDALAEGCRGHDWVSSSPYIAGPHTDAGQLPAEEYRELWDKLNAKRSFGWDVNPWVWVIEFLRISR